MIIVIKISTEEIISCLFVCFRQVQVIHDGGIKTNIMCEKKLVGGFE